jgi:hypothetical protein
METVISDGRVTVVQPRDASDAACAALREDVLKQHPDRAMLIPLVEACAPEALAVIGGRKSAVEVLFPGGSSALVENVYAKDPVSKFFNVLTAHAVETLARSQRAERPGLPVSVLEIGAGTGGTSVGVLERLEALAGGVTYDYTDISTALLQGAEQLRQRASTCASGRSTSGPIPSPGASRREAATSSSQ